MRSDVKRTLALHATVVAMALTSLAPIAHAQPTPTDVVTVGTVTATGTTVDVPVYIRDISNTPLGIDQPAGSRIQSYAIKVNYSPAPAVQSVTFSRAGITSSLTPTQELTPSSPGAISLIDSFSESTNLIPFTLNGAVPGNQVGVLHFTLSPSVIAGSTIVLTLDPTLTTLTDEGGDAATEETVGLGNLTLVNGAITAPAVIGTPNTPTLSTTMLLLLAVGLAVVGVRTRL